MIAFSSESAGDVHSGFNATRLAGTIATAPSGSIAGSFALLFWLICIDLSSDSIKVSWFVQRAGSRTGGVADG
jgi:hypothetical protein